MVEPLARGFIGGLIDCRGIVAIIQPPIRQKTPPGSAPLTLYAASLAVQGGKGSNARFDRQQPLLLLCPHILSLTPSLTLSLSLLLSRLRLPRLQPS